MAVIVGKNLVVAFLHSSVKLELMYQRPTRIAYMLLLKATCILMMVAFIEAKTAEKHGPTSIQIALLTQGPGIITILKPILMMIIPYM